MAEEKDEMADLLESISSVRRKPAIIREMAVLAELEEQAKPKRDAKQQVVAGRYWASPRTLRIWVADYRKDGLEGLADRGGQGAKPRYSREEVDRIIDGCLEEEAEGPAASGGEGEGEGGAEGKGCEACDAAEKGEKPKREPPDPCPCRNACKAPRRRGAGGCGCEDGKPCKCRCCRPMRLSPKGPRHAPGCPNGRISPKNGTTPARVMAVMEEKLGGRYCERHTRRIMGERKLTRRRITRQHRNHAPRAKVRRWQGRLDKSIERYEADGWAIYVHDEGHAVHDRKNGYVWGRKGERSILPRSSSGGRATYHCSVSTAGRVMMDEYARGDSFTFMDHIGHLMERHDKVVVITDNHSSHFSKDRDRLLRRLRRKYPGKKIRIRRLPVGSPYLSIVEAIWNMMKSILLARHHYPAFNDMRWDMGDFAENTKTIDLDAKEYLFRDPAL